MELIKNNWNKEDYNEFREYLLTFAKSDNDRMWSKRIAQTNYDMLAIPATTQVKIAKEIAKGNYQSFLNVLNVVFGEELLIAVRIVSLIKDFNEQKHAILKLIPTMDSWEATDTFKVKIKPKNTLTYYNFSLELLKSDLTFGRRLGAVIFLKLVGDASLTEKILKIIEENKDEKEYYVNMCYAWVICEAMVKQRDITIKFWQNAKFNKFVNNKAISKCNDSFRVSLADKMLLKTLKITN
ncbi:MAG: DNA alkylation repair protein [bacterium]|nr:DNA alkylation repair protein [bacterium]